MIDKSKITRRLYVFFYIFVKYLFIMYFALSELVKQKNYKLYSINFK